jgi:hypothetical protein
MSTTLDGAEVAVLIDGGRQTPFVLDVDQLGSSSDTDGIRCELTPAIDALADVSADVITLELTWGASEWMGPLTLTEAGSAAIVFHDPERMLDPGNTELAYPVAPGRLIQVAVDGTPVWTGKVATIVHDLAGQISSVQGADAIPELAAWAISVDLAAGVVSDQATALLLGSGWPHDRWRVEGSSSVTRVAERITGNLAAGLRRLADAELGAVFVDRTGVVVFRCRSEEPPGAIVATLGDRAIGVVNLANTVDRRLINTVVIDMAEVEPIARTYTDDPSIQAYGTSSLSVAAADLGLT